MIDIFGGRGGGIGGGLVKWGPAGPDALELTKYVPRSVTSTIWKYDMQASYVLNTKNDCILYPEKKKQLIKEVVNEKLEESHLKHVAGSQPCELLSLTPVGNKRFQCSMSFKGDSVYFAENGLLTCNKAGTGFLNLTLRV